MSALKERNSSEKFKVLSGRGNKKATIAIIVAVSALALVAAGFGINNTVVQYKQASTNSQNMEEISKSLEEMYGGLNSVHTIVTDNRTTLGQSDGGSDVVSELDTLDSNITTTQAQILALKDYIDNGGTLTQEEYQNVVNQYSNIEENINSINNDLSKTIKNIDSEISNLQASNSADYKNIINNLSDTKKSLTTANTQIMNSVTSQMTQMQTQFGSDIKNMEKTVTNEISDTKEKITDSLESSQTELKTILNQNQSNLTTQVSANHAEMINAINDLKSTTSSQIEEVFQSASSGKYALTSAINGVNAAAGLGTGSSFDDIGSAVRELPLNLKYNAGGSYGELSSDYVKYYVHRHTHADGTRDNRNIIFANENPGGCYVPLGRVPNCFMTDAELEALGWERDRIYKRVLDDGTVDFVATWEENEDGSTPAPNCFIANCGYNSGDASCPHGGQTQLDSQDVVPDGTILGVQAEFTYSTSGKHQEYGYIGDWE